MAVKTSIIRRSPQDRNVLVVEHIRLVGRMARRFFTAGERDPGVTKHFGTWDDVIQFGRLALIKAADTYDESLNVPFRNYACLLIVRAFKRRTERLRDVLRDATRLDVKSSSCDENFDRAAALPDKVPVDLVINQDMGFLVGRLPRYYRKLIYEHYWLRRSLVEMARDRGKTPTSINRSIDKSIERLKEMMEEE